MFAQFFLAATAETSSGSSGSWPSTEATALLIVGAVGTLAWRTVYDLPTILICVVSVAILFLPKVTDAGLIAGGSGKASIPAYLKAL